MCAQLQTHDPRLRVEQMSTTAIGTRPFRRPVWRGQIVLVIALIGLATLGWIVTDERMRGMDAGPGSDLGSLGFYVTAWVVMMAAMMFPSIAPMVLAYARISPRMHASRARTGTTTLFVAGYLVSWTAFGIAAYALYAVVQSIAGDAISWHHAGPYVAGGVIMLAAVYQLTPAKDACLRRCRAPFAFLTDEWRDGRRGALVMGMLHGAWCVGCCWGLMAALFAVGVMSVGWMVVIAILIAVEKLIPWPRPANYTVAGMLVALGIGVAFAPQDVPGLTLPDSPSATGAMHAMHGKQSKPAMHQMPGMQAKPAPAGMREKH
jgi:predicted metal-binding membrane protein